MAGVCKAGGCALQVGMHGRGDMHGRGHAWQGCAWSGGMCGGGVHGRGVCVAWGMHGRGHAWQTACVAGGVHGRGHAWQERWPLQWTVRILLECILGFQ